MKDLQKLVSGLSQSGALNGFLGGVAGGGLTSMVASKKGRKIGKKALKYGALAAVGGLAWKAYKQYSANQSQSMPGATPAHATPIQAAQPRQLAQDTYTPDPRRTIATAQPGYEVMPSSLSEDNFEAVIDDSNSSGQLLLMRAMIAAAYADGHIDENERQTIFNQVENLDLSLQEKATLFDELRQPLTLSQLVEQVPNAQTGIEVYAASASAIDLAQPASTQYLQALSNQLCIPHELVSHIHQQLQTA